MIDHTHSGLYTSWNNKESRYIAQVDLGTTVQAQVD